MFVMFVRVKQFVYIMKYILGHFILNFLESQKLIPFRMLETFEQYKVLQLKGRIQGGQGIDYK